MRLVPRPDALDPAQSLGLLTLDATRQSGGWYRGGLDGAADDFELQELSRLCRLPDRRGVQSLPLHHLRKSRRVDLTYKLSC